METEHLISGVSIQYRHLDEIYNEYKTSANGLDHSAAREARNIYGSNNIPPPVKYPDWLCCLLPCLLHTPAMEAYNDCIPENAPVLRGGRWLNMSAKDFVMGDILRLERNTRVGADIRIIEAEDCKFDTSMLTGKHSLHICDPASSSSNYLESPNMAFAGFLCVQGSCTGVVVATGSRTMMADIIRREEWPVEPNRR